MIEKCEAEYVGGPYDGNTGTVTTFSDGDPPPKVGRFWSSSAEADDDRAAERHWYVLDSFVRARGWARYRYAGPS
ncbi:hypothetical protein [Longispora urticae]